LLQVIQQNNLNYLSTYWPTDATKIPDLLDLAVTNGISDLNTTMESNLDLESDHSAVTITISANIIRNETPPRLCNRRTNWVQFQIYINKKMCLNMRLKKNKNSKRLQQYLHQQ
jgi:hypothetical protein